MNHTEVSTGTSEKANKSRLPVTACILLGGTMSIFYYVPFQVVEVRLHRPWSHCVDMKVGTSVWKFQQNIAL